MKPSIDNPPSSLPSITPRAQCGIRAVAAHLATTDYALMSLIELGDQEAMARVYDAHSRMVYTVALRILKDPSAAEDVLQEVFLKIWRRPSGFLSTGGSLGAWLGATAKNRAIDVLRGRRPTTCLDDVPLYAPDNVAGEVEHNVLLQHAKRLIDALPERQREAMGMAFMQGLTHAEISRTLDAPLGTIKTHIRSALQHLAASMRSEITS